MASPFTAYRGTSAPAITAAQWGNARAGELFGRGMAQAGAAIGEALKIRRAESKEKDRLLSALQNLVTPPKNPKDTPGDPNAPATDPASAPTAHGAPRDLEAEAEMDAVRRAVAQNWNVDKLRGLYDSILMKRQQRSDSITEAIKAQQLAALQREATAALAMTSAVGQAGQQAGRTDLSNLGAALVNRGGQGLAETLHSLGDPSQRTPITADTLAQVISRQYPAAAQTRLGQAILTRQMQVPEWGLTPGQVIDLGNGVKGAATSRNSLQIIGDDGQTYEIPDGGSYEYDAQGNIVIKDKEGHPKKIKRGASENPMIAILRALRPELFPAQTPKPASPASGSGRLRFNPATGTLEPVP